MPDPIQMLKAVSAAAALAALMLLLFGWPWRAPNATRVALGWTVGVGLGFAVGCWILKPTLHWPPREDMDRFLLLVMPAVFGVELLAAWERIPRWPIGALRLLLVVGTARVLLHGSTNLPGSAGTEGPSITQAALLLGGLAAALAVEWSLLALLARRAPGRSLPATLALTCAAAGVTVLLSGYASGGQPVLPLAAALAGAAAAALLLSEPPGTTGWLGLGVVGLFSTLVAGHFFAALTAANALLLFFAPLLSWLPELPYVRRLRLSLRALARAALVTALVTVVLMRAQTKAQEKTAPSPVKEPTIQDYMDFRP
jgi:hypothetical protein